VVDLDLMSAPFHVDVVREKTAYVFNPSGQELDVTGLICLWDSLGPCGSPVKDSQRTKTNDATRRTLSVIWGDHELKDQVLRAGAWYRELAQACGFRLIGEVERQ
jgi:DNA/RNA-binding domain of Phe-tRNA-synthetase-like protein